MRDSFYHRGGLWVLAQGGLILAVLLLGLTCHPSARHAALHFTGLLLLGLSAFCGLAGLAALGRNLTPFPKPASTANLVQSGIYGCMRHPLYVSVMLGAFGWSSFRQSWPAGVASVLLAVFFDTKARHEERWLRLQFQAYAAYERRVRRFVPWVY